MLDIKKAKASPTFAKAAKAYVDGEGRAKRSRRADISVLKRSLDPFFGRKRLHEIRREDVASWANDRRESHRKFKDRNKPKPATMQNEFALLRRILNVALEASVIDRNPTKGLKLPKFDNRRQRVISPDELKALFALIEGKNLHLRPIILLACETGMRAGEIRTHPEKRAKPVNKSPLANAPGAISESTGVICANE